MHDFPRDNPWHVRVAAAAEEVVNVSPGLYRKLGPSEIELYSCEAINTGFTCTTCVQHYHSAMQVAAGTVGIDPSLQKIVDEAHPAFLQHFADFCPFRNDHHVGMVTVISVQQSLAHRHGSGWKKKEGYKALMRQSSCNPDLVRSAKEKRSRHFHQMIDEHREKMKLPPVVHPWEYGVCIPPADPVSSRSEFVNGGITLPAIDSEGGDQLSEEGAVKSVSSSKATLNPFADPFFPTPILTPSSQFRSKQLDPWAPVFTHKAQLSCVKHDTAPTQIPKKAAADDRSKGAGSEESEEMTSPPPSRC